MNIAELKQLGFVSDPTSPTEYTMRIGNGGEGMLNYTQEEDSVTLYGVGADDFTVIHTGIACMKHLKKIISVFKYKTC